MNQVLSLPSALWFLNQVNERVWPSRWRCQALWCLQWSVNQGLLSSVLPLPLAAVLSPFYDFQYLFWFGLWKSLAHQWLKAEDRGDVWLKFDLLRIQYPVEDSLVPRYCWKRFVSKQMCDNADFLWHRGHAQAPAKGTCSIQKWVRSEHFFGQRNSLKLFIYSSKRGRSSWGCYFQDSFSKSPCHFNFWGAWVWVSLWWRNNAHGAFVLLVWKLLWQLPLAYWMPR